VLHGYCFIVCWFYGLYDSINLQARTGEPLFCLAVLFEDEIDSANICDCHRQRFPHPLSLISFNEILTQTLVSKLCTLVFR